MASRGPPEDHDFGLTRSSRSSRDSVRSQAQIKHIPIHMFLCIVLNHTCSRLHHLTISCAWLFLVVGTMTKHCVICDFIAQDSLVIFSGAYLPWSSQGQQPPRPSHDGQPDAAQQSPRPSRRQLGQLCSRSRRRPSKSKREVLQGSDPQGCQRGLERSREPQLR